jgi:hypothetical protein
VTGFWRRCERCIGDAVVRLARRLADLGCRPGSIKGRVTIPVDGGATIIAEE